MNFYFNHLLINYPAIIILLIYMIKSLLKIYNFKIIFEKTKKHMNFKFLFDNLKFTLLLLLIFFY